MYPVPKTPVFAPNGADLIHPLNAKYKQNPMPAHIKTQGHHSSALLLAFTSFFNLLLILSYIKTSPSSLPIILIPSALILSLIYPTTALSIFLFSLPVFGNKPNTPQAFYLLLTCSVISCGIFSHLLLFQKKSFSRAPLSPLITLSLAYLLVSWLSLSSLPLSNLYHETLSRLANPSITTLASSVIYFTHLAENHIGYSILSVFLTLSAINLSILIFILCQSSSSTSDRSYVFSLAILFGLITTFIAGLLDYYNFIDLKSLRNLDPTVNPNNIQFRLQSFFGHSGWLAEYATLSIPFVITLLALKLSYGLRVSLALLTLLIGEVVLILCFQRGGWVSYPLTLFAVWAAIYVIRRLELGEKNILVAFKKSFFKVLISIPLTLGLAILLATSLVQSGIIKSDSTFSIADYLGRVKEIQKTSDRTEFMKAGWLLGSLHPFLGAGSESFCNEYDKHMVSSAGKFFGKFNLPLHGTAHNVYFQIFSGKGVLGLTLLILLALYLIFPSIKLATKDPQLLLNQRCVLLSGICFGCAFLIYGVVQEIFYIQSLQYLFFAVIGLVASIQAGKIQLTSRSKKFLYSTIAIFFFGHLSWEYTVVQNISNSLTYGCYDQETTSQGQSFRWCGPLAKQVFPVIEENGNKFVKLKIAVEFLKPGFSQTKLNIKAFGQILTKTEIPPLQTKELDLKLPEAIATKVTNNQIILEIQADSDFIPAKVFGTGDDFRVLSFKILKD